MLLIFYFCKNMENLTKAPGRIWNCCIVSKWEFWLSYSALDKSVQQMNLWNCKSQKVAFLLSDWDQFVTQCYTIPTASWAKDYM